MTACHFVKLTLYAMPNLAIRNQKNQALNIYHKNRSQAWKAVRAELIEA
jgi:hypothetical protein